MFKKIFIILLLFILFTNTCSAGKYYVIFENDGNYICNVTYAEDSFEYYFYTNLETGECLTCDKPAIIIMEQKYTEDYLNEHNIVDKPHIIIPKIFSLFFILIFAYIAIQTIKRIKRLF